MRKVTDAYKPDITKLVTDYRPYGIFGEMYKTNDGLQDYLFFIRYNFYATTSPLRDVL
jgi:hypothetical protein